MNDATLDQDGDEDTGASDPHGEEALDDQLEQEEPDDSPSLITSDTSLAFDEANAIAARRGGRLILLVGEVKTGKTTLLVELWNHLLTRGSLGSAALAGSRTALAFEERAFLSRIESGRSESDTQRTAEEDDGLLHLRVRDDDKRAVVDLFLADVTGEHFERIREGTGVADELPWCARVDRFVVLVDGDALSRPGMREVAFTRVKRQALALSADAVVSPTARIALALVKEDALSEVARARFTSRKDEILAPLREVDGSVAELAIAARPKDGSAPRGMEELMAWILESDRDAPRPVASALMPTRSIARVRP